MDDLSLLRLYEPIIHFTQGEMFFPCAVDEYVKRCSLWIRDDDGKEEKIVSAGDLTVESLANYNTPPPDHTYYLQFVQEPLKPNEFRQWLQDPERPDFKSAGRLARVSLSARLIDSLFDLSLVVRGNVPGGTTARADYLFREMRKVDGRDVYYGRIIRDGNYIILHYLFFYVMNNWRSGFYGVNDHEADWEQIFVYLSEEGEEKPKPLWVAFASHDFKGDDLRRHWDDPELKRMGTHPIIFAGAGSHASYFARGEYLMSIAPSFLKPLGRMMEWGQRFWAEQLGQGQPRIADQIQALLRVPFVDYARGDGVKIGPYEKRPWTPIMLAEADGWAERYRGLWGLDTRDFIGGERAPGGAKFNRDGSVRQSWADPLGWAGLDKVAPPRETAALVKDQIQAIEQKQVQLTQVYELLREKVRVLALETVAFSETDYQTPLLKTKQARLAAQQEELQALNQERSELQETKTALQTYLKRIEAGDWGDKRAHIAHTHAPEPPIFKRRWILDIWAALSSGLLIIALIVLLSIPALRSLWYLWTGIVIVAFAVIESAIQGRIVKFLLNFTIFLAIITVLILIWQFWLFILIGALAFFVIIMLRENLRELRRL
ncbi:hypothetical protein [Candidatus Leptofilum sp.]|uniref:hypothetical protein n=1 Tax=Candidatus Leptofilum sp. TaxID=3241576 RepID=UPI003B592052